MKKYIPLLFCSLFYTSHSIADPFYGEEQEKESTSKTKSTITKKGVKTTSCELPENANIVNIPIEFEELKLVGVLKYNNITKALFIDKNSQLFDFSQNDFIKDKSIQINEINTKAVKYTNWDLTDDCNRPYQITLKL